MKVSRSRDRHDRSRVLHCRAWRWGHDAAERGKRRCGCPRHGGTGDDVVRGGRGSDSIFGDLGVDVQVRPAGIDMANPVPYTGRNGDGDDPAMTGHNTSMWVATSDLPQGGGHPFYERLNQILNAAGFDAFVEQLCAPFYARMGRPSLAPGRYFRLLLVGYFEGLDSERAIAWRSADSLSLRSFLRLAPPASPPDHSMISRTRRLLSLETHQAVFTWVLQQLADAGLLRGKTVAKPSSRREDEL